MKSNDKFVIKNIEFIDESNLVENIDLDLKYNGVDITIFSNREESLKHVKEDFNVLMDAGIEKLVKELFIPWLKGDSFKDMDDNKIYEGIKIYQINYDYHRFAGEHSPTKETDYFGEFEFDFESSSEYTKDLLQACAFCLLVNNGKVYKGLNFDI